MTQEQLKEKKIIMKVKIKKLHPDAVIPNYAREGDAGMDLTAISKAKDDNGNIVYSTGLSIEIPTGYVGLIFPRSSVSKYNISLCNSVGVIDSGYRGEITLKFTHVKNDDMLYKRQPDYKEGDRIGQLIIIPYPQIEFEEVEELSETERGVGGYGSTGK
jgi:dUTP pyrophosphatase